MTILFATLAVALAAFCVWLTVRIVNRRERWAKWTLVGVVGLPVLYVASFGPACWVARSEHFPRLGMTFKIVPKVYWPFGAIMRDGPPTLARGVVWYGTLGTDQFLVPAVVAESYTFYGVLSGGSYIEFPRGYIREINE